VSEYRLEYALSLGDAGKRLIAAGARADAHKTFERSRDLLDQLSRDFPGLPIYRESLASNRFDTARLLHSLGKDKQAEIAFREAIAGFELLVNMFEKLPRYRQQLASYSRQFSLFLLQQKRATEAESMYRLALSHSERLANDFPEEADHSRQFARYLVFSPIANLRDPERAVAAARHAVDLAPTNANFWNTLGLAQYRAGRSADAIASLQKSVELRGQPSVADGLGLSLSFAQAGNLVQAREWYDRTESRLKDQRSISSDVRRLRNEAADVLKVDTAHNDSSENSEPPFTPEEFEP